MSSRLGALAFALVLAATPVLARASTTGSMRGRVVDANTHSPIADAAVNVSSASQTASGKTDAGGNFAFISLAPDTYTVSVQKPGYTPASQAGITILADQSTNVSVSLVPALKTIAEVHSVSGASLVRAGTTSDVFSYNASQQRAATALGGSGALNQAYSAIAAAPGVSMPTGQQAWYQSVYIRGGDYDQVAYEFDGVPVIRESDSAPITTLSALGQQEVQVYTGGTPATSDSPGLAGYINQVIKTGTYPGYGAAQVAVGGPTFYHKLSVEAGGASPNRMFSYYIGTAGYDQTYRYDNQFNGAGDPLYFFPLYVPTNNAVYHILDGSGYDPAVPAPWGGYFDTGSVNGQSYNADRETIANLHFGIPHRYGSGRDDVQLLYVVGNIFTNFYSSANDIGAANVATCTPAPTLPYCNPSTTANFWPFSPIPWLDSTYYAGPLMQTPNQNDLVNGPFPSGPTARLYNNPTVNGFPTNTFLDPSERDTSSNAFAIEKLQYQRNISNNSFLRFNAYSEYTNWFIFGPNAAQLTFGAALPDYEVLGHIYGGNLTYSNQLSAQHQLTAKISYMTQKLQTYNAQFGATGLGTVISSYADNSGNCYNYTTGAVWSCYDPGSQGGLVNGVMNLEPGTAPSGSPAAAANAHWLMTENGYAAQVDNVTPYFSSASISDVYHPNEKLTVNIGARLDRFSYRLDDLMSGYPARQFWFNAFDRENCGAPGFAPVSAWNGSVFVPCSTFGPTFKPMWTSGAPAPGVGLTNVGASSTTSTVFQPRVAFTWDLDPWTVIRGSYGRYARPAATSYQQYNTWQQDLASFISQFYAFGYTTPDHAVFPDTADNFDLSLEKQLKGTQMSFKITPFYRRTHNQLQYLAINPLQGTLAGLNIGTQENSGVEFSFQDGDFNRNGLSMMLSYTYMNSRVKYAPVSNGASVIDTLNTYIQQYNSYTQSCDVAKNPAAGRPGTNAYAQCGTAVWGGQNASASLPNANGVSIENPYYTGTAQPLLDRNAWYAPYDVIPSAFNAANGFETPNTASLILNYRRGRWALTPSLTYDSGSVYGSPLVYPGYVPQSCTADPQHMPAPYTNAPGVSCSGVYTNAAGAVQTAGAIFLPDPFTGGKFDSPGSLQEPSQLTLNLQMSYDISPRMTLTVIVNNLYNKCFQRGYAWDDQNTCIYSNLPSNILGPSGNFLTRSATPIQVLYPYGSWFNNTQLGYTSEIQPFQVTAALNVRL
ncbi:MAG TPA: TonB-dependent receptor [Candidatus Baltobacteraceae bacterium]|nr:TonB-dependent receptor [Candidatus Baltobacteraceae bacterium]